MVVEQEPWIVQVMSDPAFYDHPVASVEMLESHISWIFLAGDFVYKVKKPVDFGFLDFSTLANRKHYCHEELRLNRRFAPHLYLAVDQIGGGMEAPVMGGEPPLEFAVKMERFPQSCQFDRLLHKHRLELHQITAFAGQLAGLHQRAVKVNPNQEYGTPDSVLTPMLENFTQIRHFEKEATAEHQLQQLEGWTRETFTRLKSVIEQRRQNGFVRECHGDIHLANLAWHRDQPLLFDCIEFNENLRWIDVINDIAFMVMDLDDREEVSLGWHFLNHYLQGTGDYAGLPLLNFYKVYRAMVRAKVNCLRLEQEGLSATERREDIKLYHSYLELALSYMKPKSNLLLISHGFSGSGKTTFAAALADQFGMLHLQSDRERKRLHDLAADADTRSPIGGGIYSPDAGRATYQRLQQLAETILAAGYSVIVDATFLHKQQRDRFRQLAEHAAVPFLILDFPLGHQELRRRIKLRREKRKVEISEATGDVLDFQLRTEDPLTDRELSLVLQILPETPPQQISERLREWKPSEHATSRHGK